MITGTRFTRRTVRTAFGGEAVRRAVGPASRVGGWRRQTICFAVFGLSVSLCLGGVSVPAGAQPKWREASPGYQFEFPRDHASHPEFKLEWWYYTGNVQTADGRRFGYQVTFFRVGVDPAPANPSRWALRDLFMTHLAVSDPAGRRYRFDERLSRGGPGLAGADTERYRVWNEDWIAGIANHDRRAGAATLQADQRGEASLSAEALAKAEARPGAAVAGTHFIRAFSDHAGVDLVLEEGKPPAINGLDGISQKGAMAGNASHYYSLTRMPTRGTLLIDGERFEVTGESWMDHEFGTSFLEKEQQGWDWMSIQLADGRELMLYQLRRGDGSRDPRSSGTLIDRQGATTHLGAEDFTLTPAGETFRAPSGAVYPIRWSILVPKAELALEVTTPLDNQELSTEGAGISYWEGVIDVKGTNGPNPVNGRGYLEMTGYRGSLGRVMSGQ